MQVLLASILRGSRQAETAEQLSIVVESNDFLAAAVKKNPRRFAALQPWRPRHRTKPPEELDRRVRQQGFKGTLINGHTRGRYLDDEFFSPILERAEALKRPDLPAPDRCRRRRLSRRRSVGFSIRDAMLASAAWGWHIETAVHLIRMILGGVFDRHPKLQVVIGHLGEGIPFMLPRLNKNLPKEVDEARSSPGCLSCARTFTTPSGGSIFQRLSSTCCSRSALDGSCSRLITRTGRWWRRMHSCNRSVSEADRERIAHGNAAQLLGL